MEATTGATIDAKDQMRLNVEAYGRSYKLCLEQAKKIVADAGDKKIIAQDIADVLFDRFWTDQEADLDRKIESRKHNSLADIAGQIRGRI